MKKQFICFLVLSIGWSFVYGQNSPIAVNDNFIPIFENFSPQFDTSIVFNLLTNDYDSDGDQVKIKEIYQVGNSQDPLEHYDSSFNVSFIGFDLFQRVYKYRICQINDTTILSNWAYIDINPVMGPGAPVAINDTFNVVPGYNFHLDVLQNDYSQNGDPIFLDSPNSSSDSTINVFIEWFDAQSLYSGETKRIYIVSDTIPWSLGQFDMAMITIRVENTEFYDSLSVNNINALFNCFGNHFWDMAGGPRGPRFYAPNGSPLSPIFSNSLWIGGLDEDSNLHLAAERYRQDGIDFWHGPISENYDSIYDLRWYYIWKVSRAEVEYHMENWSNPDYECPQDILSWPGNGDVNNGEALVLAPFYDANGNELYEPISGDWPLIKGDQALFFIFNDAREEHTESEGEIMGIEIHGMAYAFETPKDSALWNSVFIHYDIINRSENTYTDCYLGNFSDFDLGNPWDDYVGCDVQKGIYYSYNGDDYDEDWSWSSDTSFGYHESPPVMGVQFIGGPFMDTDGIDNPEGGCNESINGLNFGDTIVDNERLGMTRFMYFNNGGPAFMSDPSNAAQYYKFLKGIWKDDTHVLYGGNGHTTGGALGPECNFMFPSDSDTCNWGTGGAMPNGGYNQNGLYWDEETLENEPSDRRGLGVSGPFTFEPGQIHHLDLAFVYARDYNGSAVSSIEVLQQYCDSIYNAFAYNPDFFSSINPTESDPMKIRLYPNPARDWLTIDGLSNEKTSYYTIYDILGNSIISDISIDNTEKIDIQHIRKGLYILIVRIGNLTKSIKFIKK